MILAIIIALLVFDVCLFTFFDRYIISFLFLLGMAVGAFFLLPTFAAWAVEHMTDWPYILKWMSLYLVAGASVATLKWGFFNLKIRRELKRARDEFSSPALDPIVRRKAFVETLELGTIYKTRMTLGSADYTTEEAFIAKLTPAARKYIDRVTFWALQWPLVLVGLILEDLLARIGEWLSDFYDFAFTRVARMLIGSAVKGI